MITKRVFLAGAAVVAAGTARSQAIAGNDEIALWGDSNTYRGCAPDGGPGYDPAIDVSDPYCLENQNLSLANPTTVVAHDPLDYEVNFVQNIWNPVMCIGPGLTFLRWYRNNVLATDSAGTPVRNVRITATASGGSGLVANPHWVAGGAGLVAAIRRFNNSITQNTRNVGKFIMFTSGANDASAGVSYQDYLNAALAMIDYIRGSKGVIRGSNIAIGFEGLCPSAYQTSNPVWQAIVDIPKYRLNVGVVDTSDKLMFAGYRIGSSASLRHFTAASQRNIATGFGKLILGGQLTV